MASTVLFAYVVGAVVVAVVAFIASTRLVGERGPTAERIGLSLAAGAVWPMILLGLAELGSFAMYAKTHEHYC